jgi:uncharacterized membrane protein
MSGRTAMAVTALAGVTIAGYLTVIHYTGAEPVCGPAHGCSTVQHSAYAKLAGVPVALLGLAGYVAILVALVRDDEASRTAAAFLALTGFGFSAWLTYVELARIDAVCVWCVASAVCMTVLAVLATMRVLRTPSPPVPRASA